jgi:hypothetical protein
MSYYSMTVRNGTGAAVDHLSGMVEVNDAAARIFGNGVVWDLMRTDASHYTGWSMEITEGKRAVCTFAFEPNIGPRRRN